MRPHAPDSPQIFSYRNPGYAKLPIIQLLAFSAFVALVLLYFQYKSPWHGGFFQHPEAYKPVCVFLALFWLFACSKPIVDLLRGRNERIVLHAGQVAHYNAFGKLRFQAPVKDLEFVRSGVPAGILTVRSKRYIFRAGKKYLAFSDEIRDVKKLLRALGVSELADA